MRYNNGTGWRCGDCDALLDNPDADCAACAWREAERAAVNNANPFTGRTGGAVEDEDDVDEAPARERTPSWRELTWAWIDVLEELGVYDA